MGVGGWGSLVFWLGGCWIFVIGLWDHYGMSGGSWGSLVFLLEGFWILVLGLLGHYGRSGVWVGFLSNVLL